MTDLLPNCTRCRDWCVAYVQNPRAPEGEDMEAPCTACGRYWEIEPSYRVPELPMIIHLTDADGGRVPAAVISVDSRFVTAVVAEHYYRFRRADGTPVWSIVANRFSIEAAELARLKDT